MNLFDAIQNGETKVLEFKETLPKGNSLAKTVIAFSNTSGGKLIIGVNDQREIIGLDDDDVFALQDSISSIIYDRCYPTILPEIYTVRLEGHLLLVIDVFRGNLLPYFLKKEGKNKGTYIRIGATNRKASFENILELERQKRNTSFDEEVDYEIDYRSLNLSPIQKRFSILGKHCDVEQLKNLKLLKDEHGKTYVTNALLILLGQLDQVAIQCARFRGVNMDVFLDKKEYRGDLFSQLDQAEAFIKNFLHLRGEINGLQRTDIEEIPTAAIREALVNAVVHRDYSNTGRDIKVGVYDDVVNIVSPGSLPYTITEQDLLQGRSEVRNRIIARVFKALNYIEQWGTGIRRIKSSCLQHGLREPEIKERGDFVDVMLYRKSTETVPDSAGNVTNNAGIMPDSAGKSTRAKLYSTQEQKIVSYIRLNSRVTTKDVEQLLSIKDRRARSVLHSMMEKHYLLRKGKGRNTYYVLSER